MSAVVIDIQADRIRTVLEWRFLKGYARAGSSWLTVAKRYATRHGEAIVMKANDAILVLAAGPTGITMREFALHQVRLIHSAG